MGPEEKITSVLAVDEFKDDEFLVLLTQVRIPGLSPVSYECM